MLFIIVGLWLIATLFVGVAVPFLFKHVFQKYQADRIFSMVGVIILLLISQQLLLNDCELNAKKAKADKENYNVKQSKIAIGSGGFLGKGFLKGTQTQGDFVPEQHTDFIFTSVGENFGFVGSTILMLLYFGMMLADRFYCRTTTKYFYQGICLFSVANYFFSCHH